MSLWFRVSARAPRDLVEPISHAMMQASPGGIEIEEPVEILGPEQGFRVREGDVLIHAYVPPGDLGAVLVDDLRRRMEAFPGVELIARPVHQEDWANSWKEFFGLVDPGGRVVVAPTWIEEAPRPGRVTIRIDPGQAFGTGHHETTRLCLLALDEYAAPGVTFLDLGTGSGVLAIAAVLLGAGPGLALDIDPAAAAVAAENILANAVEGAVSAAQGTLEPDHPAVYDLVIANIFADPLIAMAGTLGGAVRPGAAAVLSGILAGDARRVVSAMEAEGFMLVALRYDREWCAIDLLRGPAPGRRGML